jgi:class 3 adenylate cyclase
VWILRRAAGSGCRRERCRHEVRKTVTLVFTDLKDSTRSGERLDSEALHE